MVGAVCYISYWSLYCIWSSNCKYNKFIMTQEDKDLLLRDLCARLPYGVKCQIHDENYVLSGITSKWLKERSKVFKKFLEDVKTKLNAPYIKFLLAFKYSK